MKKFLRFPLDIQTFGEGEGGNGTPEGAGQAASAMQIDYEKIAEVVSKRSAGTEDKVLQGFFKQQGLTQEEATKAISEYKQAQATKKQEEQDRIANMQQENAALKAQILNADIDKKVAELANTMGIQSGKVPFLCKLIDRTNAADNDGKLVENNIKSSIESVVKEFPDFKSTVQSGGFQQIGGGSQGDGGNGVNESLDAAFGVIKN